MKRNDGRTYNQVRPIFLHDTICEWAAGSVLIMMGKTKVICTAIMQPGVPQFLRGKGTGWLTAEYAMLPAATQTRTAREASAMRRNDRNIEISRLIGRALRSVVDLSTIGEKTIYIDCDVIQADGGTRTASITGACLALKKAIEYWVSKKIIEQSILIEDIAAVSAGIIDGQVMVDLNCQEDNRAQADFNFIVTRSGKLIEMQGGVEGAPIAWDLFDQLKVGALAGIDQIFSLLDQDDQQRFSLHKEQLKEAFGRRSV
ncbi:MAG: ribonuclease PH [Candidatus Babeliales bacterium]